MDRVEDRRGRALEVAVGDDVQPRLDPWAKPERVGIAGDTIRVYAPIQMSPLTDDRTAIKRLGHKSIGGIDCNPAGPFGTYSWKVSGDRLTLRPLRERCPDRKQIWTHTWRRVGDVDDWRAPKL